jgi:hypothetical protein
MKWLCPVCSTILASSQNNRRKPSLTPAFAWKNIRKPKHYSAFAWKNRRKPRHYCSICLEEQKKTKALLLHLPGRTEENRGTTAAFLWREFRKITSRTTGL